MRMQRMRYLLVFALTTVACKDAATKAAAKAAVHKELGDSLKTAGQVDRALAQYDTAIQLDSTDGKAINNRGATYQDRGEFDRAIRDFDRAIALNPAHAQALKNRGRAKFMLGQYPAAVADLTKALPYDSANAYVVIWIHIARRRLGEDDAREFAAQLAKTDSTRWPAPVGAFYLGKLTREQLLQAAAVVDPRVKRDQRCAASFFLAEDAMIRNKPQEARPLFEDASANCPPSWTEHLAAVGELQRLPAAPPPRR